MSEGLQRVGAPRLSFKELELSLFSGADVDLSAETERSGRGRANGSSQDEGRDGKAQQSEKAVSPEDVAESVELMNQFAETLDRNIEFEFLRNEGMIQARIKRGNDGELIRSIPSDDMLLIRKKIDEFMGLFVDELR